MLSLQARRGNRGFGAETLEPQAKHEDNTEMISSSLMRRSRETSTYVAIFRVGCINIWTDFKSNHHHHHMDRLCRLERSRDMYRERSLDSSSSFSQQWPLRTDPLDRRAPLIGHHDAQQDRGSAQLQLQLSLSSTAYLVNRLTVHWTRTYALMLHDMKRQHASDHGAYGTWPPDALCD